MDVMLSLMTITMNVSDILHMNGVYLITLGNHRKMVLTMNGSSSKHNNNSDNNHDNNVNGIGNENPRDKPMYECYNPTFLDSDPIFPSSRIEPS